MIRSGVAAILMAILSTGTTLAQEIPRTVSVGGKGVVTVRPDLARLSLTVEKRDASLSVAQQAAAKVTAKVLELLENLDVDRGLVNSTGATVQPDYRWNRETNQQELLGYIVQRRIEVEIRDLDNLGKLIDGAVRAGVNQMSPPVLDSSRRRDAYRDALAKAAEDAHENAAVLARTLGVELGPIVQINTAAQVLPPRPLARAGVMEVNTLQASVAPPTYNAGDMRLEATVSAVFELAEPGFGN